MTRLKQEAEELGLWQDPLFQHHFRLAFSYSPKSEKFLHLVESRIYGAQIGCMYYEDESTGPVGNAETGIWIGNIWISQEPFFLDLVRIPKHILIIGASGFGKTTLLALIAEELLKKSIRVYLFDHKDSGSNLLNLFPKALYVESQHERWNIFKGFLDQHRRNNFVASLLADFLGSHPGTRNLILSALGQICHNPDDLPSLEDFARVLAKLGKEKSAKHSTASRALLDLCNILGAISRVRNSPEDPFLGKQLVILSRKDMPERQENFLSSCFFTREHERLTASGHDSSLKIVHLFDEGLKYFGAKGETSRHGIVQREKMTKDRSYGIAVIICTQSGIKMLPDVVDNCSTVIAMGMNNPKEAEFAGNIMGLSQAEQRQLLNFEPGEAFVYTGRHPVHKIKVPFRDLGHGKSKADIEAMMKPLWEELDTQVTYSPKIGNNLRKLDFLNILETEKKPEPGPKVKETNKPFQLLEESVLLLRSCDLNSQFGVVQHYRSLGWSAGKGNRIKNQLLDAKALESHRIAPAKGGRPKEFLRLTPMGETLLRNYDQNTK